ncbi:GTPase IMAP family member 7-like [Saccostrea cucullata]|uniref:GTPase IMAP family member 7-like n=1 Tax=Saccostrea cuccullata TaxID=36930 RepID=UPI002ED00184
MAAPGPHAFILVLNISRFTKEDETTALLLFKLFENAVFEHFIVLFTRLDDLEYDGKTLEEYLQSIPKNLKSVLGKCGDRYIAFNNRCTEEKNDQQVKQLLDIIDKNLSRTENKYYTDDMFNETERLLKEIEIEQILEPELNFEKITEKYRDLDTNIRSQNNELEKNCQIAKHHIAEFDKKIKILKRDMSTELKKMEDAEKKSNESRRENLFQIVKNSGTKVARILLEKSDHLRTRLFNFFKPQDSPNVAVRRETQL